MMKTYWAAIFLILVSSTGIAQIRADYEPNSYASTSELIGKLESRDAEVRKSVAASLGTMDPNTYELCYDFDGVEERHASLIRGDDSVLLLVRSDLCQILFVVPVVKQQGRWVAYKAVSVWTKFTQPSIKIESLVGAGEEEVIASNVTVDEGTGILQRNMTIFKFYDGGLKAIFDRPEYQYFSVPINERGKPRMFTDQETSTFSFLKSDEGRPGIYYIVEARSIKAGDDLIAADMKTQKTVSLKIYREFVWNPLLHMYRMYGEAP